MFFRRIANDHLFQSGYLIGCQANGTALVVDPTRVIEPYLAVARQEGLEIVAVADTHIHADYVSGIRELAAATGARMYLTGAGPADWQYAFRGESNVTVIGDGDTITIGNIRVVAKHTPGHTPEHLSFLVTDGAAADAPMGILTGDFVFVGDVGRPDLLERAAHVAGTAEAGAHQLFQSLQWFKTLPDHLQVWPGHGAGSACGKGLGAVPQSTVGYERRYNWALGTDDEALFVRQVLAGQPEPPGYFGRMKVINRDGPPVLGRLPEPRIVTAADLASEVAAGKGVVVDTRPAAVYAAGHIPGSLNLPLNKSFTSYAGSVLPYDRPLYFILAEAGPESVQALVESLVVIGFEQLVGAAGTAAVSEWAAEQGALATASLQDIQSLQGEQSGESVVLDVRNRPEWDAGHLPGARLIPLPELTARLGELPKGVPIRVHCQSGARSAVAASVLRASGFADVTDLSGGFLAWMARGGAVERGRGNA